MVKWHDILHLNEESSQFFPREAKKIATFLNTIEATPEGQQVLLEIQEKQGSGNRLPIIFNNTHAEDKLSSAYIFGEKIHFNIQDFTKLSVFDKRRGGLAAIGLEQVVFHELVHAADPKLTKNTADDDPYVNARDGKPPPSEAHAVARTHAFITNYFPHLPELSDYLASKPSGYIFSENELNKAMRNMAVSDSALVTMCQTLQKFDYGHVSTESAAECRALPAKRKQPRLMDFN